MVFGKTNHCVGVGGLNNHTMSPAALAGKNVDLSNKKTSNDDIAGNGRS